MSTRLDERNTMASLVFRYLLDRMYKAINIFLKKRSIFIQSLISYLIYFKSQHTLVRAICELSAAVFGFALAVIIFEILLIFTITKFTKSIHYVKYNS